MRRLALALLALLACPPAAAIAHHPEPSFEPEPELVRARVAGRLLTVERHADGLRTRTALSAAPVAWCGDDLTADDVAHQASPGSRVKVVYAHASDRPNRLAVFAPLAQADVEASRAAVRAATGGTLSLRVDLGTRCGPQFVDVQRVSLPHPVAHYGTDPELAFERIREDVAGLVGPGRNVTLYADGILPAGGVSGVGEMVPESFGGALPGLANPHARGGFLAVVFGDGTSGGRTETFLHETGHNLGAVGDSAPHGTGLGHCWDDVDVMCYPDGGPRVPSPYPAPFCPSGTPLLDCGNDDYLSVSPPPGSYLSTHWNLVSSPFLCPASSCDAAPAPPTLPPSPPLPPGVPPPSAAPTASFTVSADGRAVARVRTGRPVVLDASPSTGSGPLAFRWDLDGDGVAERTGRRLVHAFPRARRLLLGLTVTDGARQSATAERRLDVVAAGPGRLVPLSRRLSSAAGSLAAALRRGGLRALVRRRAVTVRLTPPVRGILRGELRLGRRVVARAARRARSGRDLVLVLRPGRRDAAALRARRRVALGLGLAFTEPSGRRTTARRTLTLRG